MNGIFKNAHRKLEVLEMCLFIKVVINAKHSGGRVSALISQFKAVHNYQRSED